MCDQRHESYSEGSSQNSSSDEPLRDYRVLQTEIHQYSSQHVHASTRNAFYSCTLKSCADEYYLSPWGDPTSNSPAFDFSSVDYTKLCALFWSKGKKSLPSAFRPVSWLSRAWSLRFWEYAHLTNKRKITRLRSRLQGFYKKRHYSTHTPTNFFIPRPFAFLYLQ